MNGYFKIFVLGHKCPFLVLSQTFGSQRHSHQKVVTNVQVTNVQVTNICSQLFYLVGSCFFLSKDQIWI